MNENKFPGALTMGYMVIFITMWLFALAFSGWLVSAMQEWVPLLLIFNILLVVVGLFSLYNNDKIESILFLSLGTFWASFLLRMLWFPNLAANTQSAVFDGWAILIVAIVFFCLWFASFNGNLFRKMFLLGLWLAFLSVAIQNLFNVVLFGQIFVYLSFITAIFAGIYAVSTIIDLGKFQKAKAS